MSLTLAAGYDSTTVAGQVETSISNYIDGIPMGGTLPYGILYSLAFGVSGVTNVSGVTLNGGTSDLVAGQNVEIVPGTISA